MEFTKIRRSTTSLVVLALLSTGMACGGPPSKDTLLKFQASGVAAKAVLDANISLPEELLQEKIIDLAIYTKVRSYYDQASLGVASFNAGMATALASEKPDLKVLAPVVADIVGNLRNLRSLSGEKAQKVLAALELSLRIVATYFAVQISDARALGLTDQEICARVGMPYSRERFDLLATGL